MLPKLTHSAALEPPDYKTCGECDEYLEECRCSDPCCESCGDWATMRVRYEDEDLWFCDDCEYEGVVVERTDRAD